jgi:hypothetical protein
MMGFFKMYVSCTNSTGIFVSLNILLGLRYFEISNRILALDILDSIPNLPAQR